MKNQQRYKFEIHHDAVDTYPNDFRCWVMVIDHATTPNTVFRRRGYGKFIGNFSPIWISINGVRKQLTEWEKELLPELKTQKILVAKRSLSRRWTK